MTDPAADPLQVFGEDTARPESDTTSRMKQRLHVYVAQDRARRRRRRRRILYGVAAAVLLGVLAVVALSLL
jgi:hypothetical protein